MSLTDLSSRNCAQWLVEEAIRHQNSSPLRRFSALHGFLLHIDTLPQSIDAAILSV